MSKAVPFLRSDAQCREEICATDPRVLASFGEGGAR